MTRTVRILLAMEIGFAVPITVVLLLVCCELVPPHGLVGAAVSINEVIGHLRELDRHSARWLREGYWAQDVLFAAAGAGVAYPLLHRRSNLLPGVVGVAVPLSVAAIFFGFHSWQSHTPVLWAFLAAAWAFGVLSAYALEREKDLLDRRMICGSIGLLFVAVAFLLYDVGTYYFQVAAWGGTAGGAALWAAWVAQRGYISGTEPRRVA
jgi:hypothetical protein